MNSRSELKTWTPANISALVRKVASLKLLMNCVLKREKSICGERSTTRQYEKSLDANSQTKTCNIERSALMLCFPFCMPFIVVLFCFAAKQKYQILTLAKKKKHPLSFWGHFLSQLVNLHTLACECKTSEFLQVHLKNSILDWFNLPRNWPHKLESWPKLKCTVHLYVAALVLPLSVELGMKEEGDKVALFTFYRLLGEFGKRVRLSNGKSCIMIFNVNLFGLCFLVQWLSWVAD